jgi:hypothetical protein
MKMKKLVIILILSLSLLLSCGEESIEISYDVSAYDVEPVSSVHITKGDPLPLPELEDDWLDFKGWYLDPAFDLAANDVNTVDKDTTLYAFFEPSITIAVIGDGSKTHYQDVLRAIDDYSDTHNRLYKAYDWQEMPMSYDLTKDAIEDAVALGIDIILLTESWQQSRAVYDAQSLYPEVNFVLFGYEPREYYYYAEPTISDNTISIKTSSSITGFLAGYMAVSEGYQHLGFFGSNGSHDFESSIGFVAGAFYAANQYDQDVFFNERSFKIVDHTTLLVSDYFAEGAFDTGTEVIYTPSNENTVIEQVASERARHVILGLNSPTEELDSVLAILKDSQYHTTIDILNDYFSHDFKGGDYMAERAVIDFDISSLNQTKLEAYQTLLNRVYTDDIEVPLNYDELIVFIEDLGMGENFDLDAYTLETVSMFPFN